MNAGASSPEPGEVSEAQDSGHGAHRGCRGAGGQVRTKDSDTALTVAGNLTARLKNLGDDVDTSYYWDAGHGADNDPGDFVRWIATVSGYRP